jgi:hypothetical protein
VIDFGNRADTDQFEDKAQQFGEFGVHAMHVAVLPLDVHQAEG